MNYEKCSCTHCGQNIEYPAEGAGQTVPCPTCANPITLLSSNQLTKPTSIAIPPAPATVAPVPNQKPINQASVRSNFSKLTEETIRAKTKRGYTPLHRAAKLGRICEIPRHLLTRELFLENSGETPLHVAAKYGHLDQVPSEFLTKETLTVSTEYLTPKSIVRTETPLHIAVRCGHADQIPKEFLTPEFLRIPASGYQTTLLHNLAYTNRLDLVPEIYADSEIWNLSDYRGRTPRDLIEEKNERETYIAGVRNEQATDKQKEKLRWFGCSFDEGITKGQAVALQITA